MSRKTIAPILACLVAGIAVAMPPLAQGQQSGSQQGAQQSGSQQGAQSGQKSSGQQGESKASRDAPPAGVVPLGMTVEERALVVKGWRASKLIGATVYNDKDERIGKIEDMIVSPDGKLSVAVIEVGGFLGLGKHRVAIPVEQFADINAKKLVLPKATKQALKEVPQFMYA